MRLIMLLLLVLAFAVAPINVAADAVSDCEPILPKPKYVPLPYPQYPRAYLPFILQGSSIGDADQ